MAAALSLALSQAALAACPLEGTKPFTAGPVHPVNGFAAYVRDAEGLALELCLTGDGTGICFFDPPIANNSFSQTIGFGPEAFWWLADNTLTTAAVDWTVVMAAEAAWAAEVPGPGEQFPFTRLRIRLDVAEPGIYTMTHPYGQETFTVTTVTDAGRPIKNEVNETFDIPFAAGAQGAGRVGPWLTSVGAPFTSPLAPAALFIGDGTPRPALGSPCGNNLVRVSATGLDGVTPLVIDAADADSDGSTGSVSQPAFSIFGQVYAGAVGTPLAADAARYSRDAAGAGFLAVFAAAPGDANVAALGATAVADGRGRFFASQAIDAAPPASVAVTASANPADPLRANNLPTTVSVDVADLVTITRAEATCSGAPPARSCSLTVAAASSDVFGAPALTLAGFGAMTSGTLTVPGLTVVPASVTVTSSAGGSDTEPVRIVNQ
jgi:hypothetical protein